MLEPIIMKVKRYPVPSSSTLIDAVMDGYVAWREESAGSGRRRPTNA
jgi:hypothetical protein